MGKIVVHMSVSLDGFFEGPEGDLGWHQVDDELHDHFNAELRGAAAFLNGRRSYELMARFWPAADRDPASPRPVREFAGIWRDVPKVVYSRTLQQAEWNATVARDVVPEEVRKLAAGADGELTVGGADLIATFLRHDLVDAYRLYVHPVVLGRGRPLFPATGERHPVRLAGTRTFGNGVVLLHHVRADA